jgi:hypothetical protein
VHPRKKFCDIGVVNNGHDGVTVRHGSVREFAIGVALLGARDNRVISISSSRHVLFGMVLADTTRSVVSGREREPQSGRPQRHSRSSQGWGLPRNPAPSCRWRQQRRPPQPGQRKPPRWLPGQKADRHSLLKRNIAVGAEDDGFRVNSRTAKLTRNQARRNGDLGVAAIRGVIDGGGNVARHNGDPRQCTGIACG